MRWARFLIVPVIGVSGDCGAGYATGRVPGIRDEIVRAIIITAVVALTPLLAARIGARRSGWGAARDSVRDAEPSRRAAP